MSKNGKKLFTFAVALVFSMSLFPATSLQAFADDATSPEANPTGSESGGELNGEPSEPDGEGGALPEGEEAGEGEDGLDPAVDPANDPAILEEGAGTSNQELKASPVRGGAAKAAVEVITSISLSATEPICGTQVSCPSSSDFPPSYNPAPPVTVTSSNCSIQYTWWVEGDGKDLTSVFPRTKDFVVDGSSAYKFVIGFAPAAGYVFPSDYSLTEVSDVVVSITTGTVLGAFDSGSDYFLVLLELPAKHDEVVETTSNNDGSKTETTKCSACGVVVSEETIPASTPEESASKSITPVKGSAPEASTIPQTGDTIDFVLPAALVVVSALVLGASLVLRRRSENK